MNDYDSLCLSNLTRMDVLEQLSEIEVVVKYKIDRKELIGFPGQDLTSSSCIFNARIGFQTVYCGIKLLTFAVYILEKVEVDYVTLPGWKASIEQIRLYDALPDNCNKQLKFTEESLKVTCQVDWVERWTSETLIITSL